MAIRRLIRLGSLLFVTTMALAILAPSTFAATQASELVWSDSEKAMMTKVNDFRAANGKVRLGWDKAVGRLGRKHSCEMRNAGSLYHTDFKVVQSRLTGPWTWWGENIGVGYDVNTLFQAFVDSPVHRANMLDGWGANGTLGIGIRTTKDGKMWVTMTFLNDGAQTTLGTAADNC